MYKIKGECHFMKKIMNDPSQIVDEMLDGLAYTHADIVERVEGFDVIVRTAPKDNKVAIISGGGAGHEPSHAGFVGEGMLSAAVSGPVFTSPAPDQILEAIKAADEGAGVFLVIKNYSGDVMNFEMAQELADMEDIQVETVIVDDDIGVEDSLYTQGKRGVAGTVLVHKVLGYYAAQGKSLAEIKAIADELVPNIHTIGLALTGATTPEGGKPSFNLAEDEIEYGVGIHGEPGYRSEKLKPSKGLAQELVSKLLESFDAKENEKYGVFVNGMGGTPLMEQYVFMNDVRQLVQESGLDIVYKKIGDNMTSLEMQGLSLTLIKLEDEKIVEALTAPANTIAWK